MHVTHYFEVFSDSVKHFKNQFFFVASLYQEAYAMICTIRIGTEDMCVDFFISIGTKITF